MESASSRRNFLMGASICASPVALAQTAGSNPRESDREYWIRLLTRIAGPVLSALSRGKLRELMPVEAPHGNAEERRQYTHLEALGRLVAGMAPWLEISAHGREPGPEPGPEEDLRRRYADLARRAIAAAVNPSSPDYMNFSRGSQPVVDAAFLALGVLRAPNELWEKLDRSAKPQLVEAMRATRAIRPGFNNWLLFSATVEAFLARFGEQWDPMRVDYAVRQHEEWYKGDGIYGDGPQLHWDYYNSFVIHPMLLEVVETISRFSDAWKSLQPAILARAKRYAAIQERLIGPDGGFPAIGRSLAYRCGAFHLLADMALRGQLPETLEAAQVRAALTAVMRRTMEAPGTFTRDNWLTVGFCGHQPAIAERYISTGSLYLCSTAFLPLGLPEADPFWSLPPKPWTSQRIWSGDNVPADHAL